MSKEKNTRIAMRCTQEQFDAIKPKLKDIDCGDYDNNYEYIISADTYRALDQCDERYVNDCEEEFEIHEEWNEEIFLEACGIEIEIPARQFSLEELKKAIEMAQRGESSEEIIQSLSV